MKLLPFVGLPFLLVTLSACKQQKKAEATPEAVFSAGLEDRYLAPYGCPNFLIRRNLEELKISNWAFGQLDVHESCQNKAKTVFKTGADLEKFLEGLDPLKIGIPSNGISSCIAQYKNLPPDAEKQNMVSRAVVADTYYTLNKISYGVTGVLEAIANLDFLLGEPVPLPVKKSESKETVYADKYVPKSLVWVKELGNAQTCQKMAVTIPRGSPLCRGKKTTHSPGGEDVCYVEPFEMLLEQTRIALRAIAKISFDIGKIENQIITNSVHSFLTRNRIVDRFYVMDGYGIRPSGTRRSFDSEINKAIASLEAANNDLTSKSDDKGFDKKDHSIVQSRVTISKALVQKRVDLFKQYSAWTSTIPWLKMDSYEKSGFMNSVYRYGFWEHFLFNLPDDFNAKGYYELRHAKSFSFKNGNNDVVEIDISKIDSTSKDFLTRLSVAADMATRDAKFTAGIKETLRKNRNTLHEKLKKYYKASRCLHNRSDAFFDKPIVSVLSDKCKNVVVEVLAELPEVYVDQGNNKISNDDAFFQDVAYSNPDFDKDNTSTNATYNRLSVANELSQARCRTNIRDNNSVISDTRANMIFAAAFTGLGLLQSAKFAPVIMAEVATEYAQAAKLTGDAYIKYLRTNSLGAQAASSAARARIYLQALQQSRNALNFAKLVATGNATIGVIDMVGAVRICETVLRETMSNADRTLVGEWMRPNLIDRPTCPATMELFDAKKGRLDEIRILPIKTQRALIANAESGVNQCMLTLAMSGVLNSVQALDDVYRMHTASKTIQQLKTMHR